MILTVTLNAAMDRTVAVPNFQIGRRHRAVEHRGVAGGKGVNIARALKQLGQPVIATGLAGGPTGTRIIERLAEESILHDFTRIRAESRTNTAVIDPTSGRQTEINERGPEVEAGELASFVEKLVYLAKGAEICVIAGSVPPGIDTAVYAQLVTSLDRLGVPVVLDSYGEPLRRALRAAPALASPNLVEAEEVVGHEFTDEDEVHAGLRELVELGAREAVITLEDGCVALLGSPGLWTGYRARVEALEPIAAIGSGDAFLAGLIAARYQGREAADSLAYAVACGAESTQHFGAGTIDPREVERFVERVEVERVEAPAAAR